MMVSLHTAFAIVGWLVALAVVVTFPHLELLQDAVAVMVDESIVNRYIGEVTIGSLVDCGHDLELLVIADHGDFWRCRIERLGNSFRGGEFSGVISVHKRALRRSFFDLVFGFWCLGVPLMLYGMVTGRKPRI